MNRRTIAVIDLKAFYSFVECLDRGLDPWKVPLVVADKERGTNTIVLSVSPFLKKQGIPSRCRLKELPKKFEYIYAVPRMERYLEKSAEVISVLYHFVAEEDIHVYSIDETFVDLTSYLSYYQKTPSQMVSTILKQIKEDTGLEATAGIGDNFFLAKIALDVYAKRERNGIAKISLNEIKEKVWPITPLNKVWGIGLRTEAKLNALGMFTLKDIATSDINFLKSKFGVIGEQLWRHANGVDEADIHEKYEPCERSLSLGQVLFRDYKKDETITIIREMVDTLALRMRNENKMTGLVSIYIGYSKNAGGFARRTTLLAPTDDGQILLDAILEIYRRNVKDLPIRRVVLCFGHLSVASHQQLNLFEDDGKQIKRRNLQKTLDFLQNKYGKNSVLRGSSLLEESTIIERNKLIGGHHK
ncbi:MAG TPA: damage repair protein [Erysipelotrichaceae bacterium]|nr:damage repair protein [Erysipelotrichaceae bacterium]